MGAMVMRTRTLSGSCLDCSAPIRPEGKRCGPCHRRIGIVACGECRVEFKRRGGTQRFCSVACGAKSSGRKQRGENHPNFVGRVRAVHGYVRVYHPGHPLAARDGYVLEHRYVLHESGVDVPSGFHVHHINRDRSDNRLENLEVLSVSEHRKRHRDERGETRNQFGVWPRVEDSERREHKNARQRDRRAAHPERERAYKAKARTKAQPRSAA